MTQRLPDIMRAAALDRFGGVETIKIQMLPVPEVGSDEVLIRIESADVVHGGVAVVSRPEDRI